MSNNLVIEPTEFINSRTGEKSFGVRVYDDYESAYINTWESVPEDDFDVLDKTLEDEKCKLIIESYFESKEKDDDPSLTIGGEIYTKKELNDQGYDF